MYECKKAYSIDGIPYIVCGIEPRPTSNDKSNLYHSLCPYQRFCGEKRCAVLLPAWRHCKKIACQPPQEATNDVKTATEAGAAKKSRKK